MPTLTRKHRTSVLLALSVSPLPFIGWAAFAAETLPTGGTFVAGAGKIAGTANQLTVTQSTKSGIIDWSAFSIGRGDSVRIDNGSGATLNRVTGTSPSSIAGSLTSTGSTYLVNQNGVVVTPSGKVITGGSFVASTRDTSNSAFMGGAANLEFTGTSSGTVTNQGSISAGANAVLIGKSVSNTGNISAPNGIAGVVAGDDVVLQPAGAGLQIEVKTGSGDATTSGNIAAAQALIDAAGGNAYALAGNNGGLVRATGTKNISGHVWLMAPNGTAQVTGSIAAQNANGSGGAIDVQAQNINVSGMLNASDLAAQGNGGEITVGSPTVAATTVSGTLEARGGRNGGNGGSIETSGEVLNTAGIKVDTTAPKGQTGNWTLDPYNVTISSAATSNNALSSGTFTPSGNDSVISATDLQNALQTTNVTVTTGTSGSAGSQTGDITVAAPVTWSANVLTLDAYHSINVNAAVSATGTAGLTLKTNDGGTGGDLYFTGGHISFANTTEALTIFDYSKSANGVTYTLLGSMAAVQAINSNPSGNYALANSLDASGISAWLPIGTNSSGGIINNSNGFAGTFEGLGNTISNLTVNPSSGTLGGLFGYSSGTIRDVGIVGGSVNSSTSYAGGLVGESIGTITNAYATDTVSGSSFVGGLVGYASGSITGSYATGAVNGFTDVGGLVGTSGGAITNSYATGAVTGTKNSNAIGGLVGNASGTISTSFAIGAVTSQAGGFPNQTGGLVGLGSGVVITDSYAAGSVHGFADVGGLAGELSGGSVATSYSRGPVTGSASSTGGLVGLVATPTTFTSSYWDTQVSGQATSAGGTGQTTSQLQGPTLPAGFSSTVWGTGTGQYPYLLWHGPDFSVTPILTGTVIKTYDGTVLATLGPANYVLSGVLPADQTNVVLTVNGTPITSPTTGMFSTKNAGIGLAVTVTGLGLIQLTNNDLYLLGVTTIAGNIGTINPAALTYTANPVASTYGSALPSFSGSVTGFVNGETLATATTGTASFTSPATSSSNAGIYPINGSGLTANNGNYVFVQAAPNATALTINPVGLTLVANNESQTYGGVQPALTYTASGLVNGDTTASLSTQPTLTTVPATSNVGTYPIAIGGAYDPNYTISYTNGRLTINPAALTLIADNKSQTYGGTQPQLTYTANGLVNGDTTASLTTQPALATVPANSRAGTYPITIGGASDPNYTISYVNGTLTINSAALTLTADNQSQTYGGSQPGLTYTANGLVNGDTTASLSAQPTLTTVPANSKAGSYPITIGGAYDPNYTISYVNGTLTINPAALTLTADNQSQVYGGSQPALTYTATGLVNGDSTASLTTQPTLTTAAANSSVGTYPIAIGAAVDPNYTISYVNGMLTINPAALTLIADNKSQTYGGTQPQLTYTANGLVNGDTTASLGTQPTLATVAANSNAGNYPITIGGASDPNYTIGYVNGALTINPAGLTLTADNKSQVYGGVQPALTYTANGLVNGDTTASLGTQPTLATVAANSNAGNYPITIGGASDPNYTISYVSGVLAINPAALTLTADNQSQVYGGSQPALTYTATGLVNGDTTASFTTQPTLATVAANSNAGTYPIMIGGALDPNYTISYVNGTLTINPVALTLTADNKSQTYGGAQPTLTYTAAGLVNGDTTASLTTQPMLATAAANSNVGTYPITIGAASDSNYTISYVNGTLAINPAALTLTADNQSQVYGGSQPGLTYTAAGLVNGDTTASLTAQPTLATAAANSNAGNYPITIGAASDPNYTISYVNGTLTINPAALTLTADNKAQVYGGAQPALTYTAAGLVNGDTTASLGAQPALATVAANSNAGNYPITIGAASDPNYTFSYVNGTLTINPAALTLTADNKAQVYGGSQPALTYTAAGLVNSDTTASFTTQPTLATVAANSNAGNYPITIGAASDPNYTISYVSGTLTINPAALTLTADNQSQVYGGSQPALTYTATGLVNGDTTASFTTQPTLAAVAANSNAGSYPITIGAASDPNYTISYVNGTLTINPAALTLTADNQSQVYGGSQPALTYTATGLVNGDTTASFTTQPTLATVAANSNAGSFPITIGAASDPNYTISYVSGTLTISPAALTLTADNKSQVYGGSQPELTYTAAGLVNGDTTTSLSTQPTLATVAANSNAGSYPITIGGALDPNYTISYVNGALTINPAALTLTADNQSQVYGGSQPSLTYTAAGLVNGDTTASFTIRPALATVAANSNAGTYPIEIGAAFDPNYTISYVNGTLTINPASLTLTADDKSQTFGGTQPALTYTANGLVNGDTTASLSTQPTLTTVPANSNVGTYPIAIGGALDPNYTISYVSGVLTINSALALSVTPALTGTVIKTYDGTMFATLGPANYALSGVAPADQNSVMLTVNGTPITSPTTGMFSTKNVGTGLAVTVTGLGLNQPASGDYALTATTVSGNIGTINPATLTYASNPVVSTYGSVLPSLGGSVAGFVNGETLASATTGTASFTSTATSSSNAGIYPINGSGLTANNGNYVFAQAPSNTTALTINPASLTLIADDKSQNYGGTQPQLTYTANGLVNGDTTASLGTQPVLATVAANSNAGNYPITIGGALDPNYTISYLNGTLTINPAALTLTADNKSQTYGGAQPALTYTANGLVNGDTTASLGTQPVLATVAANSNAGNYPITIGGALDPNYTISYVNGTLTINPAALTLTADNQSQIYGGTQPVLTYTVTGLVNADTTASFTTQPALATVAANSNAGSYPIMIGAASDPNYTISYVNGTLTINPAALTLAADNKSQVYGGAQPQLTYTANGLVNGDTTASLTTQPQLATAAANSPAGSYRISIGGAVDPNYNINYLGGTLTINPAALTLIADNKSQTYGGSQPALTYTATGLVNGDTAASLATQPQLATAAANSNAGSYPITIGGASDGNYTISYVNGTLTINPASLTLIADDKSQTYGGSQPALTYTANGLVNGDTTASFTTQPQLATAAANSPAGSYGISIGGAVDPNYNISYLGGTLTINPVVSDPTVTAALTGRVIKTYDGTLLATLGPSNYTLSGVLTVDQNSVTLTVNGTPTTSPTTGMFSTKNVGTGLAVTVSGLALNQPASTDYLLTATTISGNIGTINPASLTLTADNKSQTYGGAQPALTYTAAGLVNGDSTASFTTQPTLATVAANSNAGNYPITIGGALDPNYTISYINGVLTISPATLTLTADNKSQTYGGAQPALTYTAMGLVNGDTTASLGMQPTLTTAAANSNAGTYAITIGGASDPNYIIGYINGTLTINPAALTLTADNKSQTYGGSQPLLTYSAKGLVNGDASASLSTQPALTTVAANSNAGTYPIMIGAASDPNYTISYVNGTLTINPAVLTISAASATKVYDGTTASPQMPTYQVAGLAPDTLVGSDSFTTLVQTYNSKDVATAKTLSVGYQLSDPGNYEVTTKTAPGSITPLPLLLSGTRLYDGNTDAAASILTMANLVAGDHVTLSGTGVLTGNGLTNTNQTPGFASIGTLAISGTSAADYTLANITTPVVQGSQTLNTVYISFNGVLLNGNSLKGVTLAGLNLSGASLSGQNLSGANLTGTNLSGVNLSGVNLKGATLANTDLAGATLTGANLSGDNLAGANLTGANLSGDNLSGADLTNATLVDANLSGANLSNSNLTGANLTGANLKGANLKGATR